MLTMQFKEMPTFRAAAAVVANSNLAMQCALGGYLKASPILVVFTVPEWLPGAADHVLTIWKIGNDEGDLIDTSTTFAAGIAV